MPEINCYIPIKVRITGRLSDTQLDQLGETLVRALAARIAFAERTIAAHTSAHSVRRESELVREPVDQARRSNGRYGLPSYDKGGKTVKVPVISGTEAQLEEMLRSALDYWEEQSKSKDLSFDERARARRIFILLGLGPANPFKNEDDVDRFIDSCTKAADDEDDTLKAAEQLTDKDDLLLDEGAAFPNTWAWTVYKELHTSADLNALLRTRESALSDVLRVAARLSDDVWDRGLPLSKAEASTLRLSNLVELALNSERAKTPSKDIIIQYTQALLRFERATAHYWLVHGYKRQFDSRVERIRKGDLIVDKNEYEALKGTEKYFRLRLHAFEVAASSGELSKSISALLLWDPTKFSRQYFVGWQGEGVRTLREAIAKVDARIAGTGFNECIWRAAVWATERDYYEEAGRQVIEAIKENPLKIIATLVAIIVAQKIPGLNVAVDIALLALFGLAAAQAALDLGGALKAAGSAKSVVEMEHASARLASTLVGVAAEMALWAATWGTVKGAKWLVQLQKTEKLVKTHGDAKTRDALQKSKGNIDEAEKILTKQREHERQQRELQQAEQRRMAAEAERKRKLEEEAAAKRKQEEAEAAAKRKQEQEAEAATKQKQKKEQKLQEKEEAEAKEMVEAKREGKREAQATAKEAEAAAKRRAEKYTEIEAKRVARPKQEAAKKVKPPIQRDFAAEYDRAVEQARNARNEVRELENQLSGLASAPDKIKKDLLERLEAAKQTRSIAESQAVLAEQALRESTLALHEKLGAVARNRKEFRDVARLAKGEDKVGKFRADLPKAQIEALAKDPIAVDHIVAIRRITTDPKFRGFEKLTWEDQLEIVNLRENLVAMNGPLNSSKGAIPWRDWHQTARKFYDSEDVVKMIAREAQVEDLIVKEIAKRRPPVRLSTPVE